MGNNSSKKRKKRFIILIAVLAVIIGLAVFVSVQLRGVIDNIPKMNYISLSKATMASNINVKGQIESTERKNVFSSQSLAINTVLVETGETVTEGQILCELDRTELEWELARLKAEIETETLSTENKLTNTERDYYEAAADTAKGANSQAVSARAALKSAEVELENAKKLYDEKQAELNNNSNYDVIAAENSVSEAEHDLDEKKKAFDSAKMLFEVEGISREDYEKAEGELLSAQRKYSDAKASLDNIKTNLTRELVQAFEQAQRALNTAQVNYDNAAASVSIADSQANRTLQDKLSSLNDLKISASSGARLLSLQKLEKQLEASVVRAPVSGMVTAVYAKEGAAASGILFIIENPEALKVSIKIKEYDIGIVKSGMRAEVKANAMGSTAYEGIIGKIEPSVLKNANGETASGDNVEFGAEVRLAPGETDLRIGMTAKVNIILDIKHNVYSVPYTALTAFASGADAVFAAVEENGMTVARLVPVETGIENELYVEITGGGLFDGMKIITETDGVTDGLPILLSGMENASAIFGSLGKN